MNNALIVVGVDGSQSALDAVRWAAEEARVRGAALRLVHACEVPTGYREGFVGTGQLREALVAQGQDALARAEQVAGEAVPGVRVETVSHLAGAVPALIEESAAAAQLVLGTRGLGGFTGLLVGSTAVELASRARCPLVVVRGAAAPDGPVVVGVDGTEASEAALAHAFGAASAYGTGLVAVHTWTDLLVETAFAGNAAALDFSPLAETAAGELGERLAGRREQYPDVAVTRYVERERPSVALLRHAENARLVVVGTRGRGGFRGLLLGSTSQHLLRHAPCPVTVVRSVVRTGESGP